MKKLLVVCCLSFLCCCSNNTKRDYKEAAYSHLLKSYDIITIDSCKFDVLESSKETKVTCDCQIKFGGKIKGYVIINDSLEVVDSSIESRFDYDSFTP